MSDPKQVLTAFRSTGFAEVELPGDLAERLLWLAAKFYAKPLEERLTTAAFRTSGVLGYYPSEAEAITIRERYGLTIPVFEGKRARRYCSYDFIVNDRILGASGLFGANPWPADIEFQLEASRLYETICDLMKQISQALLSHIETIGRLNSFPRDAFDQPCCSMMRLLKYAKGDVPNVSKPHTDYEFISLIKSDVPGLEVRSPGRAWCMTPSSAAQAVIVPGDMLEVATDGWVQSTLHRVHCGPEDRLAVIFFQGIGLEQEITYSIGGEKIITTFGKHLCSMLVRGAPHLQSALNSWEQKLGVSIPERNPFRSTKEPS